MKPPIKESCKADKQMVIRVKWSLWYRISKTALDRKTNRNALIIEAIIKHLDEIAPN